MLVRGANPIWSFVDLIGLQLDDTYYISFLSNTFPYLPQTVYHDDQGLIPWSQPIQFFPNGTLDPDIFGDPNLVYRIEIRKGTTQFDPRIYLIENYVFGESSTPSSSNDNNQENQISNPQFAIVNFLNSFGNTEAPNPQIILNTAGTYEIAPGWNIVLTGTGTCTITQFITNGAQNSPTNVVPPYYLEVNTANWSSVILEQTLNGNGNIWYNNYIAASILIKSNDSNEHNISMNYVPNSPGVPVVIIPPTPISLGSFGIIQGIAQLFASPGNPFPPSVNTTPNNEAYVNIQINLPTTGIVDLSNIQLFGIQNDTTTIVDTFAIQPEDTIERQKDFLAHYYDPKLAFKPIPSYLVGWDFPLNPTQLGSSFPVSAIGANKSQYTWDNTIIFQSVNNAVAVARGAQGGLQLTAAVATQVAVIQYIQAPLVNKILQYNAAVNLVGNCAAVTTVSGTVSLWYTKGSLPTVTAGTNNSIVATLDANGKPATFNNTWFEVPLKIGQEATFTFTPDIINEFSFPFWKPPEQTEIDAATFMAIVIGFKSLPMAQELQIISCSLNSGDISTIPPAKTEDETLRECQYFYEKSYEPGVLPGTNTASGSKYRLGSIYTDTGLSSTIFYPNQFEVPFKQQKRTIPTFTVYAADGTINNIRCGLRNGNSYPAPTLGSNPLNVNISVWGATVSTSNVVYTTLDASARIATSQANGIVPEQILHYTADARLGIV